MTYSIKIEGYEPITSVEHLKKIIHNDGVQFYKDYWGYDLYFLASMVGSMI